MQRFVLCNIGFTADPPPPPPRRNLPNISNMPRRSCPIACAQHATRSAEKFRCSPIRCANLQVKSMKIDFATAFQKRHIECCLPECVTMITRGIVLAILNGTSVTMAMIIFSKFGFCPKKCVWSHAKRTMSTLAVTGRKITSPLAHSTSSTCWEPHGSVSDHQATRDPSKKAISVSNRTRRHQNAMF